MTMACPSFIVHEIIQNDLSWDEAHIGYWCTFSRNPDTYNVALWKLFYAPWQARKNNHEVSNIETSEYLFGTSIADIVEKGGKNVIEVMENYGLYCVGCNTSMAETIDEGCYIHGIQKEKMLLLVEDLKKIFRNKDKFV